jgi:hypothetical protein
MPFEVVVTRISRLTYPCRSREIGEIIARKALIKHPSATVEVRERTRRQEGPCGRFS